MNYARWATKEEMLKFLKEVDINSDIKNQEYQWDMIKINYILKMIILILLLLVLLVVVKTQGVMLPQIKLAIKAGESLFINDVKGKF